MIQTVLHARVLAERVDALHAGYARLGNAAMPPGLVRSRGTPAGVLLFRDVGIEPAIEVYEIVATIVNEGREAR